MIHRKAVIEIIEEKGARAFWQGLREGDCPYTDKRTRKGAVTFSRGFRRAWLKGFRKARGEDSKLKTGRLAAR